MLNAKYFADKTFEISNRLKRYVANNLFTFNSLCLFTPAHCYVGYEYC